MDPKWAYAVEDELCLAAEAAEGIWVGGVGGKDRDLRWWVGVGGPGERLGQFGSVSACNGEGFDGR